MKRRPNPQSGVSQLVLIGLVVALVALVSGALWFFNKDDGTNTDHKSWDALTENASTIDPEHTADSQSSLDIPSLGVQAPVVYGEPSLKAGETVTAFENRLRAALKKGAVHYPGTQKPGVTGTDFNSNVIIIGASSTDNSSSDDHSGIFTNLNQLQFKDLFIVNHQGVRYTYEVYEKRISPTAINQFLVAASKPDSVTLISCHLSSDDDQLIAVVGQQITPDPESNDSNGQPLSISKLDNHHIPVCGQ